MKTEKEKLEEIAERIGDAYLMEMFWSMFSDLSKTKQKTYVKWAEEIERNNTK